MHSKALLVFTRSSLAGNDAQGAAIGQSLLGLWSDWLAAIE